MKVFQRSSLYFGKIWHARFSYKPYSFRHSVFLWYLDLDELEMIGKGNFLVGKERFSLFSFYEKDHGKFWQKNSISLKEKIYEFLKFHNFPLPKKIFLLTNLRVLGYVFNPVSFYFLINEKDNAYGVLIEVNNTFGEQKAYLLAMKNDLAIGKKTKWFYVSPFIKHDALFNFNIRLPKENLAIQINTENDSSIELKARLWGKRLPINFKNIFWAFYRYPLHTLFVIGFIHWHALILYLKKIPYYKKKETDEAIAIAQKNQLKLKGGRL